VIAVADRAALLAGVPLFAGLSRRQLAAIAAVVADRTVPAGSAVTVEGAPGVGFHVVVDGAARVTVAGAQVRMLGPGDHFGDIAVLTGSDRTATVTAVTDLRCLVLTSWDFHRLVWSQPGVAVRILTSTTTHLLEQARRSVAHPTRTGETP
jgi:CRP/FNR family transcriptional regulator, cyclic AMP receptor protein